jgi:hypothetical protein
VSAQLYVLNGQGAQYHSIAALQRKIAFANLPAMLQAAPEDCTAPHSLPVCMQSKQTQPTT